jgi:hypothetical protein
MKTIVFKNKTLLKCMLRQPAPVHCVGGKIGTNITWNFTREVTNAEDHRTGQDIVGNQILSKSHSVTVELYGTLRSEEFEEEEYRASFVMEANSTTEQLLEGIYLGYKGIDLEESQFEALEVGGRNVVTLFPTT